MAYTHRHRNPEGWNPAYRNDWDFTSSHNARVVSGKHSFHFRVDSSTHLPIAAELGSARGSLNSSGGLTVKLRPYPDRFNGPGTNFTACSMGGLQCQHGGIR